MNNIIDFKQKSLEIKKQEFKKRQLRQNFFFLNNCYNELIVELKYKIQESLDYSGTKQNIKEVVKCLESVKKDWKKDFSDERLIKII